MLNLQMLTLIKSNLLSGDILKYKAFKAAGTTETPNMAQHLKIHFEKGALENSAKINSHD